MADFRVLAIISTYNEEDIIAVCLQHLHAHGVQTYLIDDGSTDSTVARATAILGQGLLGIESLPPADPPVFSLSRILARKEVLARQLDADWFINQDADEFRESLWPECTLSEALARVDRRGYNAVDFEIFTIRAIGDPATARAHPDLPAAMYSPPGDFDRLQVRAWKRQPGGVDLQSTAGHNVAFPERRVFPLRFPLRHYPIRGEAHGARKVFVDRLPRFSAEERARGWHVQYQGLEEGQSLLAASGALKPYDLSEARLESTLRNRNVELLSERIVAQAASIDMLDRTVQTHVEALERHRREMQRIESSLRDEQNRRISQELAADTARHACDERVATAAREHAAVTDALARANAAELDARSLAAKLWGDVTHAQRELNAMKTSRSWRWTSPLRTILGWLGV